MTALEGVGGAVKILRTRNEELGTRLFLLIVRLLLLWLVLRLRLLGWMRTSMYDCAHAPVGEVILHLLPYALLLRLFRLRLRLVHSIGGVRHRRAEACQGFL